MKSAMTGTLLGGRYRLESRIAGGGMGTVWRARDEMLARPVAVKILRPDLAEDPVAARRFRREAHAAATIFHPNMANVLDYVEEEGRPGIVMELVEGETLAVRLAREGALPPPDAAAIVAGLLEALDAAHRAGVVHRDVKPGNLILGRDGAVKVADFGIARVAGDVSLTQTGVVFGSAPYIAPEQLRGQPPTPAADIYAAGVILYEALTGTRPFQGDDPLAVATARLAADPEPPSARRPVPQDLEQVVLRAMASDPAGRFASAAEMRAALLRANGRPAAAAALPVRDRVPTDRFTATDAPTAVVGAPPAPSPAAPRQRRPGSGRRAGFASLAVLAAAAAAALFAGLARGPGIVAMPRLDGTPIAQARSVAEDAGIGLRVREVPSARPGGLVLEQSVPAGTEVRAGSVVAVEVSNGVPPCCRVPDVRGLDEDKARERLEDSGLRLGGVERRRTRAADPGTVISQSPAPGGAAEPGEVVSVVLAQLIPDERDERQGDNEGPEKGNGKKGDD